MYEYTDKVIRYMRRKFIELFSGFGASASFDELNVIHSSKTLYDKLEHIAETWLLKIAKKAYKDNGGEEDDAITVAWLLKWLKDYDPVTKYVYLHEVERKRARFAEAYIASINKAEEKDVALRYWSNMVSQVAIDITDKAVMQAYKDRGVKQVRWITILDKSTCKLCRKRNGEVYPIDAVPPKPHRRCRCYLIPYRGKSDDKS